MIGNGIDVGILGGVGGGLISSLARKNVVVLAGDSRTEACWTDLSFRSCYNDNSWLAWGMGFAGIDLNLVKNTGVAGRTTQQMLDNIAEVDTWNPTDVFLMGFINDLQLYTPNTAPLLAAACDAILARLITMYDYHRTKGRVLHICNEGANNTETTDQRKIIPVVNAGIKAYCDKYPAQIYHYDFFAATVDTNSTNCDFATNYSYDGKHYSNLGAFWIGKMMAPKLKLRFPALSLPSSQNEARSLNSSSKQIAVGAMMAVSGGTASTGVTGTVCSQWAVTAGAGDTCVASIVPSTSIIGKAQRIQVNTIAARNIVGQNTNCFSQTAIGVPLYAVCRIKCATSGALKSVAVGYGISSTGSSTWGGLLTGATSYNLPSGWEIEVKTPVRAMDNTVSTLQNVFIFATSGVDTTTDVTIEQLGLYEA